MFIIILTYKKPIEVVDQYLIEHRTFLDDCYKKNIFITSGPQKPRTGGILISQLKDRLELEDVLKQDPFEIHQVAEYKIIEFDPIKYHPNFISFVE